MKKLLVLTLLILSFTAFAGVSNDVSWFKYFKGTVGEYPVTMMINKYGEQITGYYYYNKYAQPLTVSGSVKGDSLVLIAYSNNYDGERFNGMLKGGEYKGSWENDLNKTMVFKMEEDKNISAQYEYVFVTGETLLLKDYKNSPNATYLEGMTWPTDKNPNAKVLRDIYLQQKGLANGTKSPGTAMLEQKEDYFKDYKAQYKDVTVKELEESGFYSMYNAASEDYVRPVYFDKSIYVLSRFSYAYTGGAHGNYGTSFSCYDMGSEQKIELKDLLTDDGIKALPKLLEKNYRAQNDVPKEQSLMEAGLFSDTIYANDNFVFTPGCLMFCYVPYEIGPYAAGEIYIYIPKSDIEKYLNPKAKKYVSEN